MNQEEREAFFKEEETLSTLAKAVSGPLGQTAPHGNLERSFVGEKWFYYGETTEEYSLYCDEVVDEDFFCVFIMIKEGNQNRLRNTLSGSTLIHEADGTGGSYRNPTQPFRKPTLNVQRPSHGGREMRQQE